MAGTAARYKADDGSSIFVEADIPDGYDEARVSIFGGSPRSDETPKWGDAIAKIIPALEEVGHKITSMDLRPDEVNVEVGIKFVGEAGVVIARVSTEANLVVKLTWTTKPPAKPA